ncbi:MAG: hypothetical protein ACR2H9_05395 [Longimicrobiaceae bacterium]
MKAYEFPGKIAQDGRIELPRSLMSALRTEQPVRVILLIEESGDVEEENAWSRFSAGQFLAGYAEEDAIYDDL